MHGVDAFVGRLARVIDAEERAAVAAARAEPPYPFRATGPGTFVVIGPHLPAVGSLLRLGDVHGRVLRVDARTVTVEFDQPADVPPTGVLVPVAESFARHRSALRALRGHRLVVPLAEGVVAPFSPLDVPASGLDADQREALGRALAVPDLLVVLGGPGSGKTRLVEALRAAGVSTVDDVDRLAWPELVVRLVDLRRVVLVGEDRGVLAEIAARLPAANVVRLTRRREVPVEIAEFCARLCGQRPPTATGHVHRDDVFAGPLAFVDTSGLPARRRRERPTRRRGHGFYNPVEANLLARLAAHYDTAGRDWAVVVPHVAQAEEVTARLVAIIGAHDRLRRNVGAQDFRGGDRQVVLYGFTRDRANLDHTRAALRSTRAGEQLVLVGDLPALGLRDLVRERRGHDEVLAALTTRRA
ncbi:hypothetical protein [Saccharothrix variisporea]|uniref:AAA domain-containing protein n=1 Tax=Saccharothrix variisporea TaxID=543527 RepID=A0A495X4M9_9PSEU|nr:hypothetical protein [Saccharothrix variisporea]RKT68064.1 hypothetical protein DFJ66_1245 [Saccharothrix variisporea]